MKNVFLYLFAFAFAICSCEKQIIVEDEGVGDVKEFTFNVNGDFGKPTFVETRGNLQADGYDMTDLWVFDYVEGECVQKVHQQNGDADWGAPKMKMKYGKHHVYFITSMGDGPVVDVNSHTVKWNMTRDTFWKDYEVDVVASSNENRSVTLERVSTKLRVTVNDEVPLGCSQMVVTPDVWYYGLDYMTGEACAPQKKDRPVAIPESYVGTVGKLTVIIYGISAVEEWKTDISVMVYDGDGVVIGAANIKDAPFKRNRSTEYSGLLFAGTGGMDTSIDSKWQEPYIDVW